MQTGSAAGVPLLAGRSPKVPGPTLVPRKKTIARSVYLEPSMWQELAEAAEFQSAVFEALGHEEKVSRNDVIDAFLRWALDSYWEDKGGRPTSKTDRTEKARRNAETTKKNAPK